MAYYSTHYRPMSGALTPAVRFFLFSTVLVFFMQLLLKDQFTAVFALSPMGIRHWYFWQLVTYMFLHSDFGHILFNLLGLFFFGPDTERAVGTARFAALYLLSGIIGGLGWLLLSWHHPALCLGASGAIFGVLGAFVALYPDRPVMFIFFPVPMRARTMALILGLFTLLMTAFQSGQIAYSAHLAGGLAGYAYIRWIFNWDAADALWHPGRWLGGLRRALNDWRWRWSRRKFRVVNSPEDLEDEAEPSQAEVDAVLDKVAKWGLGRLTPREREILDRASRRPR